MKLVLIGYGKMGKTVEQVALRRGHAIKHVIDLENQTVLDKLTPDSVDAVIEFTHPDAVLDNIKKVISHKIPMVVGTTGWLKHKSKVENLVAKHETGLVYASNFSIGVNLMFKMNRMLARWMNPLAEYDVYVEERHHRHKADAPGGTALSLANEIVDQLDRKTGIVGAAELMHRPPTPEELCVGIVRAGDIKGEHRVTYTSSIDKIEISHEAYSREGFALGAVVAAEWLAGKKGVYEFIDTLEG